MAKFIDLNGAFFYLNDKIEFLLRNVILTVELEARRNWPEAKDHEVKQVARNIVKGYLKQMEK